MVVLSRLMGAVFAKKTERRRADGTAAVCCVLHCTVTVGWCMFYGTVATVLQLLDVLQFYSKVATRSDLERSQPRPQLEQVTIYFTLHTRLAFSQIFSPIDCIILNLIFRLFLTFCNFAIFFVVLQQYHKLWQAPHLKWPPIFRRFFFFFGNFGI